ncbi:hypothetical protein P7C71_g2274, partial [Lecanoromycetidae sp. Uapishka_2]
MSQPKATVVHNTKDSANGSTEVSMLTQGSKKSDHSSSKAITEKETSEAVAMCASDIVRQLKESGHHSSKDLELVIRSRVLDVLDPSKKGKLTPAASLRSESPDPENPYKKHTKRHTRPYGCTESSCTRKFGSKNDWKRHENSQHFKIDAWKCAELHINSKNKEKCNRVFYRREQFQTHLETDHKHKDNQAYVSEQCQLQRVGQHGQKAFWCGFCQKVVQLQKRGLDAWTERFTHIDVEHFKKGETVDNWFTMNEDIPKSALAEEKKDDSEEEKNESDEDGWSECEDEDGDSPSSSPSSPTALVSTTDFISNGQKPYQQDNMLSTNLSNNKTGSSQTLDNKSWYCLGRSTVAMDPIAGALRCTALNAVEDLIAETY